MGSSMALVQDKAKTSGFNLHEWAPMHVEVGFAQWKDDGTMTRSRQAGAVGLGRWRSGEPNCWGTRGHSCCWNLYGHGPITNYEIPNQSQKPVHVSKGMWEHFSTTLLVEVEVAILKYGSPLHFLKSSVRRRKRSPHARVRSLASPGQRGEGRGRAAPV
jgi:hypothetical protein